MRGFERFNSRHLFGAENISKGDKTTITELLLDIHEFYCKNEYILSVKNRERSKSEKKKRNLVIKTNTVKNLREINKIDDYYTSPQGLHNRLNKSFKLGKGGNKSPNKSHDRNPNRSPDKSAIRSDKNLNHSFTTKENPIKSLLNMTVNDEINNKPDLSKTLFITFDSTNVKKLERSLRNLSQREKDKCFLSSTRASNYLNYVHHTDKNKKAEEKKTVHFMDSYLKLNPPDNEISLKYSLRNSKSVNFIKSNSLSFSLSFNNFEQEVLKIKEWLSSVGIKFAYKIDFSKKEVKEFKER